MLFRSNVVILAIIIFLLSILFFLKDLPKIEIIAICLIIAGATVNGVERIFLGGAVDYLRFFDIFVFNISDFLIVLGTVILTLNYYKIKSR